MESSESCVLFMGMLTTLTSKYKCHYPPLDAVTSKNDPTLANICQKSDTSSSWEALIIDNTDIFKELWFYLEDNEDGPMVLTKWNKQTKKPLNLTKNSLWLIMERWLQRFQGTEMPWLSSDHCYFIHLLN